MEGAKFIGNPCRVYLQGADTFLGRKKGGEDFFSSKKGGQVFLPCKKRRPTFFSEEKRGQEVILIP